MLRRPARADEETLPQAEPRQSDSPGPVRLSLIAVSASYGSRERQAPLVGIDLEVRAGELAAVLGPNGAGKSTLLRVLAGTLRPDAGQALLNGSPLAALDRPAVARKVAVVAQREEIAFGYSVRDVVMMGRAPHQHGLRASGVDETKVDAVLERAGLTSLAKENVNELSGGEQKRVAIARGLAQDAEVLLLDEPAASLDVKEVVRLYDLLADEIALGRAVVVVMHDLNVAAQYASKIVLLSKGRMVAQGAVADVMTYAKLRETFDTDLYVGVNELTGTGFYVPMRGR